MAEFHLRTMGELTLQAGGREGTVVLRNSNALAILAYLSTIPDRSARREFLAELLWPESERSRALQSLRQALYYMSKNAETELALTEDGRLVLDAHRLDVDLWAFDRALGDGRYEDAVALYQGPFLASFRSRGNAEFRHWVDAQQDQIQIGVEAAYRTLIEEHVEESPERAVAFARQYVEFNPLSEKAQTGLVRALVAAGDRVGAYRAYEAYRTLLSRELDDAPGEELERRAAELRRLVFPRPATDRPGGSEARQRARGSVRSPAEASPRVRPPHSGRDRRSAGERPAAPASARESTRGRSPAEKNDEWLALGALAAVLAIGMALGAWLASGEDYGAVLPADAAEADALRVVARTEAAPPRGLTLLEIGLHGISTRYLDLSTAIPSPTDDRLAVAVERPDGLELAVVERPGAEPRVLTRRPGDDVPLAWSPDGRRILYGAGEYAEATGYVRRPAIYDLDRDYVYRVRDPADRPPVLRDGAWSPLGDRVAFSAHEPGETGAATDLWLVDADGTGPTRLTRDPARDDAPAWSPDGQWLAFVSTRAGNPDVWMLHRDGSGLRRLTTSLSDDLHPVWLSATEVGFLSSRDGTAAVWSLEVPTGDLRRLRTLDVREVMAMHPPARDRRVWVETVRVAPPRSRFTVGERARIDVQIRDARGHVVPPSAVRVRWLVSDTSTLRIDTGGWVRGVGPGRAEVIASAGGWRADTLAVEVVPPRRASGRLLFEERWSGGAGPPDWRPVGDPVPDVVSLEPDEERRGRFPDRALLSRGDAHFDSGVVTREGFEVGGGVTLLGWGRVPLDFAAYQRFGLGFTGSVPPAGEPTWRLSDAYVAISVSGDEPGRLILDLSGSHREVPVELETGGWHEFGLQIAAGGEVTVAVDGVPVFRAPEGLAVEDGRVLHLVAGGRTLHGRILHGPLRLYRGTLFGG